MSSATNFFGARSSHACRSNSRSSAAVILLVVLIAIFALRKREDPRSRLIRWRLIQLVIVIWIIYELGDRWC